MLVEGRSKTNKKMFSGRTESFKLVNFAATGDFTGRIRDVRITEGRTFSLLGELVEQK